MKAKLKTIGTVLAVIVFIALWLLWPNNAWRMQ